MFYFIVDQVGAWLGSAKHQANLGMYYINKLNRGKALKWLSMASDSNEPLAHTGLGYINILDGNIDDGLMHYDIAVNSGDAEAPYYLGLLYFAGEDVPEDHYRAFKYYSLSAERGLPDAIHMVAWCYEQGVGVAVDIEIAISFYKRAAALGVPEAIDAISIYEAQI